MSLSSFETKNDGRHYVNVIPNLLKDATSLYGGLSRLRIWSAGYLIGAEPYILSMIVDAMAPTRDHYILVTDLDKRA
jgi:chemotaxis methyl-accepting protein methylase